MDNVRCVCVWLGAVWVERIEFVLYQSCRTCGVLDVCLYLCCGGVGGGGQGTWARVWSGGRVTSV